MVWTPSPVALTRITSYNVCYTKLLREAHRINSPFIISDKSFQETFKHEADYAKGKPLNWQKIAAAIMKFDVNSLLHGAFMANLEDGRRVYFAVRHVPADVAVGSWVRLDA